MADTSIEWTEKVWNPVTGCTKVSQGCKNCYAERLFPRPYPGRAFTDVRCHPERLDAPLHWKKPRRIFVNSMSDLFHKEVSADFIAQVFAVMAECPQHTFQILTKRAERMKQLLVHDLPYEGPEWPLKNVWLGVSVEDQATADERIPLLLQTPAAVRFLSCEPLLGPIRLPGFNARESWCPICKAFVPDNLGSPHENQHGIEIRSHFNPAKHCASGYDLIHWVIAGGESGPNARPSNPEWFRQVRDQCAAAGVPFFFKQWGEWAPDKPESYCRITEKRYSHRSFAWARDGSVYNSYRPEPDHYPTFMVYRVGKRSAGRMLDGKLHDEYPA